MDSKVNFTLVGLFVVTFISALIVFIFWLGKFNTDTKEVDLYKIYLNESVAGLNIESSVKYKGVNIGVVKNININPNNSEQIKLLIEVKVNTPIKIDTYAVLESQGITGLKYIDLIGGKNSSKLLKNNKDAIPLIKSKLSLLSSLSSSSNSIVSKVDGILTKIDTLLSNKNMKNIQNTLNNANSITANLNHTSNIVDKNVKHIITQVNSTLDNTNKLTKNISHSTSLIDKKIDHVVSNIDRISDNINKSLDSINNSMTKDVSVMMDNITDASIKAQDIFSTLAKDMKSGKYNLKDITNDSLKRFDTLMLEWEKTMEQTQNVLDKYKDSPSDLIFKSREEDFGPGEKSE